MQRGARYVTEHRPAARGKTGFCRRAALVGGRFGFVYRILPPHFSSLKFAPGLPFRTLERKAGGTDQLLNRLVRARSVFVVRQLHHKNLAGFYFGEGWRGDWRKRLRDVLTLGWGEIANACGGDGGGVVRDWIGIGINNKESQTQRAIRADRRQVRDKIDRYGKLLTRSEWHRCGSYLHRIHERGRSWRRLSERSSSDGEANEDEQMSHTPSLARNSASRERPSQLVYV